MADVAAVQEMLRRWDPIGVSPALAESGFGRDEYDGYAPHIVSMLAQGCSAPALRDYLNNIRTVAMGLGTNSLADERFAAELETWWKESH